MQLGLSAAIKQSEQERKMDFMTAIKTCLGKYATFAGRAQRSEFWWFILAVNIVAIALMIIESALWGFPVLYIIWVLGTIVPVVSAIVRRLHDTNRSGWWYWIALVPIVGGILLIVWAATKGTDGENDYGDDPLGGAA